MLTQLDHFPKAALDLPPNRLHEQFPGPVLIHLPGRRVRPIFVSVLLHGNETSGVLAVQDLLKKYAGAELPRPLSIFIGNVRAARFNKRFLDGQPDYNRIWVDGNAPENEMAMKVIREMKRRNVFASVDLHNTTGLNPHHACVPREGSLFYQLATVFSRTVVYYKKPENTQAEAFAEFCPSVTVECGRPGQAFGVDHASDYLEGCLHLDHLPEGPVHDHDMELYHSVAIVKVPRDISFGFGGCGEDICFRNDLDHLNFQKLPPGTKLADVKDGGSARLEAWDDFGNDVGSSYFKHDNGAILTAQEVTPSLFTLESDAIRQDCLCCLMERMNNTGDKPHTG